MRWQTILDSPATAEAPGETALWLAVALVVAGVTALRIVFLLTSPLNLDFEEAQYWLWAQSLAGGYFSKPPLIAWIIAAITALCGNGEACIRLPSPLIHAGTALVMGVVGREIAGPRLGFWAAIAYATAPGVSFSSFLMTTDVPLLLFWSLAFWSLLRLLRSGRLAWAAAVGLAAGLGMLSKYSMLLFPACLLLHLALDPAARRRIRPVEMAVMAVVGTVVALPNAIWNLQNGLPTVRHTAELTLLDHASVHPLALLNFFAAQFVVVGPVVFAVISWRFLLRLPARNDAIQLLLWCFSLPILWLLLAESFLARAHANWAVTAYIAGILLAVLHLRDSSRVQLLRRSLIFNLVAMACIYAVLLTVPAVSTPWGKTLVASARLHGWNELGQAISDERRSLGDATVLADDRRLLALMAYYAAVPITEMVAWNPDGTPDNHLELVTRMEPEARGPFLLVSALPDPSHITRRFKSARPIGTVRVSLPGGLVREHWTFVLNGFKGY